MSLLKVNTIRHSTASSDAITLASDGTATAKITNNLSNRNLIINGAMQVAQRATSKTGIGGSAVEYSTVDRWYTYSANTAGRHTETQESDGPAGFANSMKFACTTADTSIASNELFLIGTKLEGQDLQQIKKGTSDAEKLVLSFHVKGNANATYMCAVLDLDNGRMSTKQFAVTSSWNKITIAIPADTTGAFDDDNANSLAVFFYLHGGSDFTGGTYTASTWQTSTDANRAVGISSFFDSTSRTFQFTGMQLERDQGSGVATDFEHRSYGDELARCQRYYQKAWVYTYTGTTGSNGKFYESVQFKPEMRAAPTLAADYDTNNENDFETRTGASWDTTTPVLVIAQEEGASLSSGSTNNFNFMKGIAHFSAEL